MVTVDTNIAFYALGRTEKAARAEQAVASAAFLSVQVLNEYAFAVRRKIRRDWKEIDRDIQLLRTWVGNIRPIHVHANQEALKIASRYQLQFFDSLMIAVALENGATTLYSEDMQHGLVIDDTLTITNPFLSTETQ